jgi:hypothetical protein
MLKATLIAVLLAAAGATAASAQGSNGYGHHNGWSQSYSSDGGLGRYCPPGYYPHSFPSSNGVRCEAQDGQKIYSAPF